jgi:hypothetical protein
MVAGRGIVRNYGRNNNSPATGTAVVNTPNSPVPLHLALVVVRQGKEIHAVLDSDAISTVFNRVE